MAKETLRTSLKNAMATLRLAQKQLAKLKVSTSNELTKTHVAGAIDDACTHVEEAEELLGEIERKEPPKTRTPRAMSETKMDFKVEAKIVKATKVK